eukprot:242584_1
MGSKIADPSQTTVEEMAHFTMNFACHEWEYISTYHVTGYKSTMLFQHLVDCSKANYTTNCLKMRHLASKEKSLVDLKLETAEQLIVSLTLILPLYAYAKLIDDNVCSMLNWMNEIVLHVNTGQKKLNISYFNLSNVWLYLCSKTG